MLHLELSPFAAYTCVTIQTCVIFDITLIVCFYELLAGVSTCIRFQSISLFFHRSLNHSATLVMLLSYEPYVSSTDHIILQTFQFNSNTNTKQQRTDIVKKLAGCFFASNLKGSSDERVLCA